MERDDQSSTSIGSASTTGRSQTRLISDCRQATFNGSVPLCISLDLAELPAGTDTMPTSYYVQAPRLSYLPLILQDARRQLIEMVLDDSALATLKDDQIWFECQGVPMRWHWPIGLLYDYHVLTKQPQSTPSTSQPPVFELKLHLSSPPSDKLLISSSVEKCKENYMNMIKEADYLRHGNTRRVTALRKQDQDALWEAIIRHDYDSFANVSAKLMPDNIESIRSLAVRLYMPDTPVIQNLVPPLQQAQPITIYHILSTAVPSLFPAKPETMTASFVGSKPLGYALVQGIKIPFDAEMDWLCAALAGADGWLAVVIVPSRGQLSPPFDVQVAGSRQSTIAHMRSICLGLLIGSVLAGPVRRQLPTTTSIAIGAPNGHWAPSDVTDTITTTTALLTAQPAASTYALPIVITSDDIPCKEIINACQYRYVQINLDLYGLYSNTTIGHCDSSDPRCGCQAWYDMLNCMGTCAAEYNFNAASPVNIRAAADCFAASPQAVPSVVDFGPATTTLGGTLIPTQTTVLLPLGGGSSMQYTFSTSVRVGATQTITYELYFKQLGYPTATGSIGNTEFFASTMSLPTVTPSPVL
ncbi:hypothetical protein E5Q_05646 [Mixia osmundae IAM 14324]|uniref:Autophagy protein 5 n=2 Tax=Mixia osmundae (strain CBS 9802 / IAM 14324 / JCM 22182 / KY 12970) TaxID=764103 RepID=G7E7Z8_MIXOS|nr:hypothetical protein E5Q_05646 [Mixia osmundae IAM 14324]